MKLEFRLSRRQMYVALVVGVIIALFSYRFLYSPAASSILRTFRETKIKIKDIDMGSRMLSSRDILLKQSAQLTADFENYQKRVSTDVSPSKMLEEITHIAEDVKVNFVGVEPLPVIKNEIVGVMGYYTQVPIKINLKCGYHELGKFIARIEGSARLMQVGEVNIRDDPKDIWHHNVNMVVNAFAYTSEEK